MRMKVCILFILTFLFSFNLFAENVLEQIYSAKEIKFLRDPFRAPAIIKDMTKVIPPLERYPVHQFRLLGVSTGSERIKGMLKGPDGKTYFIDVNDKIGIRSGFIENIKPDSVSVKEKVVNLLGEEEEVTTVIKMK